MPPARPSSFEEILGLVSQGIGIHFSRVTQDQALAGNLLPSMFSDLIWAVSIAFPEMETTTYSSSSTLTTLAPPGTKPPARVSTSIHCLRYRDRLLLGAREIHPHEIEARILESRSFIRHGEVERGELHPSWIGMTPITISAGEFLPGQPSPVAIELSSTLCGLRAAMEQGEQLEISTPSAKSVAPPRRI